MADESLRLTGAEVILKPVQEDDLLAIASGYYESFPSTWHNQVEPLSKRVALDLRIARFAKRMRPWLKEPKMRWTKACLKSNGKIIGYAGWAEPGRQPLCNLWRFDAIHELGHAEREGWSQAEVDEMLDHVDVAFWGSMLERNDSIRKEIMKDEPHWFLAPLWVIAGYRGKGVATMLLGEVIKIADAGHQSIPIYLQAAPEARRMYQHFGFEAVENEKDSPVMIRRGPKNRT